MNNIDLLTKNGIIAKAIISETKRSGRFKMPCGTEIIYFKTDSNFLDITNKFVLSIDKKQSGEITERFLRETLILWLDNSMIMIQLPFHLFRHRL